MEVYRISVPNLKFSGAVQRIIAELKKLYSVKQVEVNVEKSEVKVILGELGSIIACQSTLNSLGFNTTNLVV